MSTYDTISTETWRIQLPSDWTKREGSAQDSVYFESADKTKGAYFSTWRFDDDPRSAREILESFRRVEQRSLDEMDGHTWQRVDECSSDLPALSVLGVDCLAHAQHYRIVCHLLASLPWLVRSSFHDYDCTDYLASQKFFRPIIQSLEIHNENN